MLKALFLDMDGTLCDTHKANAIAKGLLAEAVNSKFGINGAAFASSYENGIYRRWNETQCKRYMPIIEQRSENDFRVQLIRDLLMEQGMGDVSNSVVQTLQDKFDQPSGQAAR